METPAMSQLLLCSTDIPFPVKAALRAAGEAGNPRATESWRRYAAFLLQKAFALDAADSFQLVDLESDPGRSLAA